MATVLFDCVYTAHKTQKSKKYQDGRIKFNKDNHKISLYDTEGNLLDSDFVPRSLVIENVITIESDGKTGNETNKDVDAYETTNLDDDEGDGQQTQYQESCAPQTVDDVTTTRRFSGNDIIAMLRKKRLEQQQRNQVIPQTPPSGSRLFNRTTNIGNSSSIILKRSPPSTLLLKRHHQDQNQEQDQGFNNIDDDDDELSITEKERKIMRTNTFGTRNTVIVSNANNNASEQRPFAQRKFGAFKPPTQTNLQNFSRLLAGKKEASPPQKLIRQRSPLFSQNPHSSPSSSSSPSPSPSFTSPQSTPSPNRNMQQQQPNKVSITFPTNISELSFPTLGECAAFSNVPVDDLNITFSSLSEYKKSFSAALCREIQSSINECITRICGLISSRPPSSSSMSSSLSSNSKINAALARKCGHKGMIIRTVKKAGPNLGRQFVKCPVGCFFWVDELCGGGGGSSAASPASEPHKSVFDGVTKDDEIYLRSQNVGLYLSCKLSQRRTAQGRWRGPRGNNAGSFVLGLPWKERSAAYSKDDLWAVRVSGETLVFRSSYHGPTKSGEIELTPLSRRSFSVCSGEYVPCQALHGPNLSTELAMLDNLIGMDPTTAPIVPFLVNPAVKGTRRHTTKGESADDVATVDELVSETVVQRNLNPDQERVVRECVRVALDVDPAPPVVLVHGVFGSGKSSVVTAVLSLIDALVARLDESDPAVDTRILFAAATNAAVDRVLLQLLREGFTSFLRVGSRRKIARELLPYSLHGMGSDDDDVSELKEMLREAKTPEERDSIANEIREVAAGGLAHRRDLLETVRVVGATSAACSFPVMDSCHFRVVFLDECCQMIEPLSLLSLGNFGCERAVLVGDPQQLRPVLVSSLGLDSADAGGATKAPREGLSRTLFSRFVSCGVEPIMLRTQYRCHPAISAIASKLFYDGRLLDGVSEEDRAPLVPGLPPVVLCHAERGKEEADNFGSFFNSQEALAVASLVKILCDSHNILPDQIDKAQVIKITGYLEGEYPVQVSTVDAFQGAERDIIILSTSRTVRLGFSDSPKRLNVAITRARRHLIVMGNAPLLTSNPAWDTVLSTALESRGGLQSCSKIISTGALELPTQSSPEQAGGKITSDTTNAVTRRKPSAIVVVPAKMKNETPQEKKKALGGTTKNVGSVGDDDDDDDNFLEDLNVDELFDL